MNTQVVTCTLPLKLVQAIDNSTRKTIESRANWLRRAAFDLATREGLLRRPVRDEAIALDLNEMLA